MQDRIIGPLTMVQFIYAVIGFGLCYMIFLSIPHPLSYLLITPIALFVVCLDFLKVNERPFLNFFLAIIAYSSSPKQRFWHQGTDSDFSIEIYRSSANPEKKAVHKVVTHEQITEIARKNDGDTSQLIRR